MIKKIVILFLIVFFQGSPAIAYIDSSHYKYVEGDFVYEYKEIPKYDNKGKLMYYTGEISVTKKNGEPVLMSRVNQSPGCEQAVQTVHQNALNATYQSLCE